MEHRAARTFVGASAVGTGVTRVILRSDTGDKATPVAPSALSCDTVFVADSRFPFDAVSKDDAGPMSGVLEMGVLPMIGPFLLPQLVRRLVALFPDCAWR